MMPEGSALGLVFSAIERGRKFLLLTVIVALAVSTVLYLLADRRYTSTASILPSSKEGIDLNVSEGGFSDIGLIMGAREQLPSIALYPDILSSRLIGTDILQRSYTFEEDGRNVTRTLLEHLGKTDPAAGLIVLSSRVSSFWIDRKTRALLLKVTTDNPQLSALIVNAYIERLEEFNRAHRWSASREVYSFVENKLGDTAARLGKAEDRLGDFLEKNREVYASSDPALLMQLRALRRDVEIEQSLYLILGRQLRRSAVDVERDTPILSVLDYGSIPEHPSWPEPFSMIFGITLAMAAAGVIFLVLRESFRRWTSGRDHEVVEALIGELKSDFRKKGPVREPAGSGV